jgi:hypothetical protein
VGPILYSHLQLHSDLLILAARNDDDVLHLETQSHLVHMFCLTVTIVLKSNACASLCKQQPAHPGRHNDDEVLHLVVRLLAVQSSPICTQMHDCTATCSSQLPATSSRRTGARQHLPAKLEQQPRSAVLVVCWQVWMYKEPGAGGDQRIVTEESMQEISSQNPDGAARRCGCTRSRRRRATTGIYTCTTT